MPVIYQDLPDLTQDVLVDLGGWAVLREGRALQEQGAVKRCAWEAPVLTGEVQAGGQRYTPQFNLRSLTFAENRCNCTTGRRGQVCPHAIALCFEARAKKRRSEEEAYAEPEAEAGTEAENAAPQIKSLQLSEQKGQPLSFQFFLPPNIARTAERDAIVVKCVAVAPEGRTAPEKLFRGRAYQLEPGHYTAGALVENWCGGRLHGLLQLKRAQLRQLLEALKNDHAFFWANDQNRPILWQSGELPGVSEYLKEKEAPTPKPIAAPKKKPIRAPKRPAAPAKTAMGTARRHLEELGKMRVDGSTQFLSIGLPPKTSPVYHSARDLMQRSGFRLEPSNGRWWLRDRHKTLNFLAQHWKTLEKTYDASFSDNFRKRTVALKPLKIKADAIEQGSGFTLQLDMDAGGAEEREIRSAMAGGQYYLVRGDAIFLFDPDKVSAVAEAQRALTGEASRSLAPSLQVGLKGSQLGDAQQILDDVADEWEAPDTWKRRSEALRSIAALQPPPLPKRFDDRLRTYQRIGVAWLWHLYQHDLGGILADEMGLGKTIQALGLMLCARKEKGAQTALVVCPASLVENWRREAAKFAPELQVFAHHGNHRLESPRDVAQHDLVVTSYSTLVRDEELFLGSELGLIIADEAQHLKNKRTQRARALRGLQAPARFVLTGTPIENSLDDLRSIFAFVLPGYLAQIPDGVRGEEKQWFNERHLKQAATYILRRSKKMVAPELPDKIEQTVYCEMDAAQDKLYREVLERTNRQIFEMEMAGESENKVRFAALTQLLRLRQVCAEPRILDDKLSPADSAKLAAFEELLDEAVDGGHRILVFSQFVSVLKMLRGWLAERDVSCCYLDGSTKNRQELVEKFNNDPSIPVFLISLKAGGTGLNLTGADQVVHFDPWWNPAVEAQATDRAHRIGQTRTVTSIKLIVSGTVEEKVLELQQTKAQLLRDLLDESAAATAKVSLADIKELLAG